MSYLGNNKSIAENKTNDIISKISYRYIYNNTPCEFYAMPSIKNTFRQYADGLFDIDFDKLYPDAKFESYAYALAYLYSEADMEATVKVELTSGGSVWLNGECIAKTSVADENSKEKKRVLKKNEKGKEPGVYKSTENTVGLRSEIW